MAHNERPLWTNPKDVVLSVKRGMLYWIKVVDDQGREYTYIGKTKQGVRGLIEYEKDMKKIFAGQVRKSTPGKEKYRAVHLALAKAYEHGWPFEFYPLENVGEALLDNLEKKRIAEFKCNLNLAKSWRVEEYAQISIADLL